MLHKRGFLFNNQMPLSVKDSGIFYVQKKELLSQAIPFEIILTFQEFVLYHHWLIPQLDHNSIRIPYSFVKYT